MTKTISSADVRAEVEAAINELNDLATKGARPLWSSFTSRLEDLFEHLTGEAYRDPDDKEQSQP